MAQLTDDCFAFSGPLVPVAEAERIIDERISPMPEIETVALRAAPGRIVAADLIAPMNLPPFDNAAVDGYAVRHPDLDRGRETRLLIVDRVTAGHAARRALSSGQAIRIFTGAPMPAGADTVFMQEDVRVEGDAVIVPAGLKQGANRRLAPALFDANRYLLAGLVERLGATPTDLGILPDDPERLAPAIASAAQSHDLVLTSGGVSTGEADHVRHALERIGRLVFWRVAIKPGRPVAMGVIPSAGDGGAAAFVGLPGNPAAVYVTFARVVRPLLLRLAGAVGTVLVPMPVRAAFSYKKKAGRREFVRVKLARSADGTVEAFKHPQEGAEIITSLTETDGLIELPEDATRIEPGTTVGFLSYAAMVG